MVSDISVVNRIVALHEEVEAFRAELRAKDAQVHGLGNAAIKIKKEAEALLKAFEHVDVEHRIASSNATDLIRSWRLARSLPGLCALNSKFFLDPTRRRRKEAIIVDVVFRRGHAWCVKYSQKYRSLLQELANLPFEDESMSDVDMSADDTDSDADRASDVTSESSLDIVINYPSTVDQSVHRLHGFDRQSARMIDHDEDESVDGVEDPDDLFNLTYLQKAQLWKSIARVAHCAHQHPKLGAIPRVYVYLPRLLEEAVTDEAQLNCRRLFRLLTRVLQVEVLLGDPGDALPIDDNIEFRARDEFGNEDLDLVLPAQSTSPAASPRSVILCVTSLFVLVSDLSHIYLADDYKPHHTAQRHQLEEERRVRVLRDRVLPILAGGGQLHTTGQGHQRLFELTDQLGSDAERERARLLFAPLSSEIPSHDVRLQRLNALSMHTWPAGCHLPIVVHDEAAQSRMMAATARHPPPFAMKTRISQEVFDLAWCEPEAILLTANKGATTVMRKALAAERVREANADPPVPLRPHPQVHLHAARSLAKYERPLFHGIPKHERHVMASIAGDGPSQGNVDITQHI